MAAPLTLGTAGHIDHGKTALVGCLTGVRTDRLPEERRRGISIALGYAPLSLPSGRRLSVVDAPGHERFVRTMVAGATGIDLYLMVVAADDGVMPQTREHAAVLRALGIDDGVVAVTKSDLADVTPAMIEVEELMGEVEVMPVSARTGHGLSALLEALERAASRVASRAEAEGPPRLHIDRAFTIRGAGTVVTGTLWSGTIGRGDELLLLPGGHRARVRSVQVHDVTLERAAAGQRVAVNLAGLALDQVGRGDVLSTPDAGLAASYLLDARLDLASGRELAPGERVQLHHGTRESPAKVTWLGGDFWQMRLEHPVVPAAGDRLVIRQIAPPDTLGGGVVLDPRPRKHGPSRELLVRLERLASGEAPDEDRPLPSRRAAQPPSDERSGEAKPAPRLSTSALHTERRLREAGLTPPLDSELNATDLAALRDAGAAVRVARNLHYHRTVLEEVERRVVALAARSGGVVTISLLRDELQTSRKFAQALLEHFDSEKLTIRRGDEHVLRRAARDP